jgi:hypothetical protein
MWGRLGSTRSLKVERSADFYYVVGRAGQELRSPYPASTVRINLEHFNEPANWSDLRMSVHIRGLMQKKITKILNMIL